MLSNFLASSFESIACKPFTLVPSLIEAKETFFCILTVRIHPFTCISAPTGDDVIILFIVLVGNKFDNTLGKLEYKRLFLLYIIFNLFKLLRLIKIIFNKDKKSDYQF